MGIERRRRSRQFKDEAIRWVLEQGCATGKAGARLGVPPRTLANGVRPPRKERRSVQVAIGVAHDDPAASRAEIAELKKRLRRAGMERGISKKSSQRASSRTPGGSP